jgi:hypothetical protein
MEFVVLEVQFRRIHRWPNFAQHRELEVAVASAPGREHLQIMLASYPHTVIPDGYRMSVATEVHVLKELQELLTLELLHVPLTYLRLRPEDVRWCADRNLEYVRDLVSVSPATIASKRDGKRRLRCFNERLRRAQAELISLRLPKVFEPQLLCIGGTTSERVVNKYV